MNDNSLMFPYEAYFGEAQHQNLFDVYHRCKDAQKVFSFAIGTSEVKKNPYGAINMGALGFVVDAATKQIAVYASDCHDLQLNEDFYANGITRIASIELPPELVTEEKEETLKNILHVVDVCSKEGQTLTGVKFAVLALS